MLNSVNHSLFLDRNRIMESVASVRTVFVRISVEPLLLFIDDIKAIIGELLPHGVRSEVCHPIIDILRCIEGRRYYAKIERFVAGRTRHTIVVGPSRELIHHVEAFRIWALERQQ